MHADTKEGAVGRRELDKFRLPVAHPDWLASAAESQLRFIQLLNEGKIPQSIHGWMVVTHCKRMLRAVYGIHAYALLWERFEKRLPIKCAAMQERSDG